MKTHKHSHINQKTKNQKKRTQKKGTNTKNTKNKKGAKTLFYLMKIN